VKRVLLKLPDDETKYLRLLTWSVAASDGSGFSSLCGSKFNASDYVLSSICYSEILAFPYNEARVNYFVANPFRGIITLSSLLCMRPF